MESNTDELSVVDNNHKQTIVKKPDYFLSFVVLFKESNTSDFLRVFSNDYIIDEVTCDSKIKIIHVPLKFQNNIQFEMFSRNQNNQCKFYFVSLSIEKPYRLWVLFTKTDWIDHTFAKDYNTFTKDLAARSLVSFTKDLAYAGTMFGHQLDGKIARPDKNRIEFSACLYPVDSPHYEQKIWCDSVTGKKYIRVTGGSWIAKFRPGYACLYRNYKRRNYKIHSYWLNVFDDVKFFLTKNLVQLTKSTGKNLTLPVESLVRFKKIETEEQYLDFVHDSLIFVPAITCNWVYFKS